MDNTKEQNWTHIIRPRHGLVPLDAAEFWRYRELLFYLTWRTVLIRYKQTAIGISWALLQPLLTVIAFTFVFGKLAKMPSGSAPYAVMSMAAVLPWQLFANALGSGSNSVVAAGNMVRKIYFPRLFIPLSDCMSGLFDFAISLILLVGLMLWFKVAFTWNLLLLPLFSTLALLAALGASLWLAALNVKYRDVKYIVPFITRLGIYISPVGFLSSTVQEQIPAWQFKLYNLNPMVGVIDGFRWAILGSEYEPMWSAIWVSLATVFLLVVSGLYYFRSTEKTFADIL